MAAGREIVTLQFGCYSNFIGAHWWNLQEAGFEYNADNPSEINHDVLFREGVTSKGHVTFTPRLLLVDLKGSLGHLRQEGDLYNHPEDVNPNKVQWPVEKVDVLCTPTVEKNEFINDLESEENVMVNTEAPGSLPKVYNLDSVTNVWADYLRTRYHPRTVSIINEYEHNSDTKPFDVFNQGANLWKTEQFQDDFTDRIRMYAEECDNMQGFHILLDGSDGFAGLGTSALEYLEDEYSTKSKLVFPTIPSEFSNTTTFQDSVRLLNLALGFHSLAEHSSLFVPLCMGSSGWRQPGVPRDFPHLRYNSSLAYHSSAVLAAALDTATLRYRLKTGMRTSLSEMTDSLSRLGRRVAVASLGLPFAMEYDAYLLDTLEQWEGPLWQTLSPNCNLENDRIWIQSVVLRGVPKLRLKSVQMQQDRNPAYTCTSVQEMLSLFLTCCSYATASHVTSADSPCNVSSPFPQIFSEFVGLDGSVSTQKRPGNIGVYSVPAIAGLHSCRSVGDMLAALNMEVRKLQLKRFHCFCNSGLEEDEYEECLNHLALLRECYNEEFDV
ncbi:protein misato homolog 1 isoform X2 [Zootermopsis nevadensis]|uniref:Misato-like protein 1 n=1 Tax=Zootermopsis nevadensis TaxID=136037 RepID=A0A067RA77_ZOONE|nr:protein misato homolog 1 isoform X2 [Zootermopsis nevadensis]KDR19639.1 Misato-like protein 1 [Zootermopsis nevadensis]